MRFCPQKKWKKILLVTLLIIIAISVSVLGYVSFTMNNDVVTQLVIKNPTGNKTALVLYHPGLSSFSHDVSYAFADGLVLNSWRVEIATSSIEAPTNISKYSLLVISSNTYAFTPDLPTTRQLERIGNLNAIKTVLLTLGAGSAQESQKALETKIQDSNGTILQSLVLYSMAPNQGDRTATEIAQQTAREIT
jgi:hypothetical protein